MAGWYDFFKKPDLISLFAPTSRFFLPSNEVDIISIIFKYVLQVSNNSPVETGFSLELRGDNSVMTFNSDVIEYVSSLENSVTIKVDYKPMKFERFIFKKQRRKKISPL